MFHVKHSKSNPVISFVFSRDYLRETRPEPPRLAVGPGQGYRSRKPLKSLNETGSRAPGPWAGIGGPIEHGPGNQARISVAARATPRRSRPAIPFDWFGSPGSPGSSEHQAPSTRRIEAPGAGPVRTGSRTTATDPWT
jgi:hypothetical protein